MEILILRCSGLACIVTERSSIRTSFVRKSAPMVALYWLENFFVTNWFISEVLPTLPRDDGDVNHGEGQGASPRLMGYVMIQ